MNVIERCKVLIKEKNQNEAIKILEEFVNENEHEQIGAHRLLSQIYKDCSDKDKAIGVLEKGISKLQLKFMKDFFQNLKKQKKALCPHTDMSLKDFQIFTMKPEIWIKQKNILKCLLL
jgi:hypothetical protein